jgi:hypothetical protein
LIPTTTQSGRTELTHQIRPWRNAIWQGIHTVGICDHFENPSIKSVSLTPLANFIDASGRPTTDFLYDEVTPFVNGIAQVMVDGKIGYIDKTGKYIWEPK